MPMSLHEKLRLYLADKHATFSPEGIVWTDAGGKHLLVAVDGPLSASHVVDAHARARDLGATLHVAHLGAANPVAQRTAARFGAALLCADELPDAAPALPPAAPGPLLPAHADDAMPWEASPAVEPPALAADAAASPLALHADPMPWHAAPPAPTTALPAPAPPTPEPLVLAHSEPTLEVAHADDAMPWGGEAREPEAPALVAVDPMEMLAVPWIHELEDDVEELPAGRETRAGPAFRPTQAPSLPGASWGLPWPRPVAPTDGLAIADPKIWNTPGRLTQMREDLNSIGAPSFGAAKPEGSAWLKRVSEFGPL